jgi:hypothetical protein
MKQDSVAPSQKSILGKRSRQAATRKRLRDTLEKFACAMIEVFVTNLVEHLDRFGICLLQEFFQC